MNANIPNEEELRNFIKNNERVPWPMFLGLMKAFEILSRNHHELLIKYTAIDIEFKEAAKAIRGVTKILNQLNYISDTIVNAVESREICDEEQGLKKSSEELNLEVERLRKVASGLRSF